MQRAKTQYGDCAAWADADRERRIVEMGAAVENAYAAGRRDEARQLAAELGREVARRSPAQIARLEADRGLISATRGR